MRVLVTGGCGFIGHHLVKHILETTDWHIVVLDSLTYAGDVNRLIEMGMDPSRVDVVWHDLRASLEAVDDRLGHIDYVIHAAAASHVDRSISDPGPFILNNVMGTINVLEWCRRRDVAKVIQVSTDEVYGPAKDEPHREWDVLVPSNPYAASKASQEAIAISYWRTFQIPVVITNTMNNFGERQHPEKFVPMTVRRLLAGLSVPVHARQDGMTWVSGSRVWLHARNHADALVFILQELDVPMFDPEGQGLHRPLRLHIAGDLEIPNDEIVVRAAAILGRRPNIEYVDFHSSRPGHDLRYALDGSRIKAMGWTPPVDFEESFERTVTWFAEQ